MKTLDKMLPNRVYMNQIIDLRPKKDSKQILILANPNIETNLEILKSGMIYKLSSRQWISDSVFRILSPKGVKRIRDYNKELYLRVKSETSIMKTSNYMKAFIESDSVYYDWSKYLTLLFQVFDPYPLRIKATKMIPIMVNYLNSQLLGQDRERIFIIENQDEFQIGSELLKNNNTLLKLLFGIERLLPNLEIGMIEYLKNSKFLMVNTRTRTTSLFTLNDINFKAPSKTNKMLKYVTLKEISPEDEKELEVEHEVKPSNDEKIIEPTKNEEIIEPDNRMMIPAPKKEAIPVKQEIESIATNPKEEAIKAKLKAKKEGNDTDNGNTLDSIDADNKQDEENEKDSVELNLDDIINALDKEKEEVNKQKQVKEKVRKERETKLRQDADNIVINDKKETLKQIIEKPDPIKFEPRHNDKVKTLNESNKDCVVANLDKTYIDDLMEKDQIEVLNSLSEPDRTIPVFIKRIEKKDNSDAFNKIETLTVTFQDGNNIRHTFSVDVPKIIDNRYLYFNGVKKTIQKQLISLPVVKTAIDKVQITTNYNKTIIERFGRKTTPKVERLFKFLTNIRIPELKIERGNNLQDNLGMKSYLEYDEISKHYTSLEFKGAKFFFNQRQAKEYITNTLGYKQPLKPNEIYLGYADSKAVLLLNSMTGEVIFPTDKANNLKLNLIDYFIFTLDRSNTEAKYSTEFSRFKVGNKYFYTRCSILSKQISLFLLLAFKDGLSALLKRLDIQFGFMTKRPALDTDEYRIVKFANGYFWFPSYPIRDALILNGILDLPTEELNFEDMDSLDTYLMLFESIFNSKAIMKGFDNFVEQMMDPITKKICKDLNLPTDFVGLMLYANSLLEDNFKLRENDMSRYRIRGMEVINAHLYQVLNRAYSEYKNSFTNANPQKISVPRNALIKALQEDQLLESYSTLNPISECEALSAVTWRGAQGLNLDEAYKEEKRSFDETMLGITGMSSPYGPGMGIKRQLSVNSNIISPRGYIKSGSRDKKYTAEDVMTFSEVLNPFIASHDDGSRIAMAHMQSGHLISGTRADPALITYGADRALPYNLSDDFVNKSKGDGIIKNIDTKESLIFVEYKDGTKEVINYGTDIVANSHGGFFTNNSKSINVKVGQKIKKDDILAYNTSFFKDCGFGPQYLTGTLTKIAIVGGAFNYEDSTICTDTFGKTMTTPITMRQVKILEPSATVDKMAKVGEHVTAGDTILKFEPAFNEREMNAFLKSVGDELKEEINTLNRNVLMSKYTGVVKDLRIYYTCNYEELSPSLKKVIDSYKATIDKKHAEVNNFFGGETPNIILPPTEKYSYEGGTRIKGQDIGKGVLIEFYIEHDDFLGIGSKITYSTALKAVVSEVIPSSLACYTDSRPMEEISCLMSPISINARMTASVWDQMYGNKIIVELGRKLREIYQKNK